MSRYLLIFLCTITFSGVLSAQEVVTGLYTDIRIKAEWEKKDKRKGTTAADTLELPFFDDFSKPAVYPDPSKWLDNYVFINNTYSENQRSSGIATFDALDNSGRLYESASSVVFEADHLTSLPINLKYSPDDDIYLSFLYEPGGLADKPETKDFFLLQFYAPKEDKWYNKWVAPTVTSDTFRAVIIRVDETKYLEKGFMFRFINYASLGSGATDPSMAGNCDQWNIDYVMLDRNRNDADTLAADVAFTKPVRSTLKTYESMPWTQFRQVFLSEMGPWITVNYRNNDNIVRNVTRSFKIFDMYMKTESFAFSAGATNIDPFTPVTYNASLIYTFNSASTDSALFRIKSILTTDIFDPKDNDTLVYYQKFSNYFAYDDGTAEAGYGVNGLGSKNAMVAVKFKTFVTDTLRAVQICFNDSYQNANLRSFDLMVWADDNGSPGDIIYSQEDMMVTQGMGINGFYTYILNDPVELTGNFFIGWKQKSETFLNAGYDINTPQEGRQYYWLNGTWNPSQTKGTIMIRAQVGPAINNTGIFNLREPGKKLRIWPNPARDVITIDPGDILINDIPQIRVTDLFGHELLRAEFTGTVDISMLKPGYYVVILWSGNKPLAIGRIIKSGY
jgi:hypothetical protein